MPEPSGESAVGTTRLERLPFAAPHPAAAGPLSWAQRRILYIIDAMHPFTAPLNIAQVLSLRSGISEADLRQRIVDLVETFDALRTTYVSPPAGPAQRVMQAGELDVYTVDYKSEPTLIELRNEAQKLAGASFDISAEVPIRFAVAKVEGMPRYLLFAASHLVIDASALKPIASHLRDLLAYPPDGAAMVERHHPLDEAAWERSEEGRRQGERALQEHERTLRSIPQTIFPRKSVEYEGPRFRNLECRSPALAMAVPALAARYKVTSTAVIYAGICAIAGHAGDLERAFLQLTLSNRTNGRRRNSVGIFTQDVPVAVELGRARLSDVITSAGQAIMSAIRFGRYPADEMLGRQGTIETERGVAFDLSCWLNDRRVSSGVVPSLDVPGADALMSALKNTKWRWKEPYESSTSTLFVFADDAGDAIKLTALIDTSVLPPDEAVAWMSAVERLLCAAVLEDFPLSAIGKHVDLVPTRKGAGWSVIDSSWIHLPTVTRLLTRASGGRSAEVFAEATERGTRLIAYIDGSGSPVDTVLLHRSCVNALRESPEEFRTAMAPHRYYICARRPLGTNLSDWRQMPVLIDGTGRE
jgi:Condensation domain